MKVYVVHSIISHDGNGDITAVDRIFTTKEAALKYIIEENSKGADLVEKPTEYCLEE